MELTQSLLKEWLHYDAETGVFSFLCAPRGLFGPGTGHAIACAKYSKGVSPRIDSKGYLYWGIAARRYRAHYLAMLYVYGDVPKGFKIDHVNGEKTDNRIANLRFCDHAGNMKNQRKSTGRSRFKGVTIDKRGRIKSRIQDNGKIYALGVFDDEVSAAMAYDRMAAKLHGEFACTNKDLGLL